MDSESKIKVRSGEYEILDSGMLLTFSDEELIFDLIYKNDHATFYFKFLNNIEDDKPELARTEFELINEGAIRIKFINYNSALGMFNLIPIPFGTIGNRQLSLAYYIVRLNNTKRRKVSFTFYLDKEVQNG